jgi:hypothetical protein
LQLWNRTLCSSSLGFGIVNSSFEDHFQLRSQIHPAIEAVAAINLELKVPDYDQLEEIGIWKIPTEMLQGVWPLLKKVGWLEVSRGQFRFTNGDLFQINRLKMSFSDLQIDWGFLMAADLSVTWDEVRHVSQRHSLDANLSCFLICV